MKFTSAFVAPIIAIVASAVAALFGGLLVLGSIQNRMEAEREVSMAGAAVAGKIDFLRRLSMDYSVWDEAARRLLFELDLKWADDEIGHYLFEQNGQEASFIVDAAGRPLYAAIEGRRVSADPAPLLGPGYAAASRNLAARAPAGHPVSGLSLSPAGPVIFSISRIAPNSASVRAPADVRRFLVMSKRIDAKLVAELARTTRVPQMAFSREPGTGVGRQNLATFDGGSAGSLRWTPATPGTTLRDSLMPWLLAFAGALTGLAAIVLRGARLNVRQLEASEARATHLANHDVLTGLPNRRAFVNHLLTLSRRGNDYAILYMDLDGFKEVNDTYGHGTGDALLRSTSERLKRVCPPAGLLARLGGDEFAIAVPGPTPDAGLIALADTILTAIRGLHQSTGEVIVIGASIGIARRDGCDYEDVVRRADIAMYAAKARGRDSWCLFEPTLDDGRHQRKALEADLRLAIERGELTVVFQPIVRGRDGSVVSVEALARWNHPTRGAIEPDIFIPVAEESGLIVALGKHILREACLAARAWPYKLAVNLSPAQFWDRALVAGVLETLRECDFPADRLEFEITETYLLRRPDAAVEIIAELRSHGIKIALDDFGTGYASIAYLRRFNLDLVKLDRSFVEGIASSAEAADVALAIIALSSALNLSVIAEGVETEEQAVLLCVAGCEYLQGWHYGRPVTAAQVTSTIAAASVAAAASASSSRRAA